MGGKEVMLESDTQRRRSHLGRDNKNISIQCTVRSRHINIAFLAFFKKNASVDKLPQLPSFDFFFSFQKTPKLEKFENFTASLLQLPPALQPFWVWGFAFIVPISHLSVRRTKEGGEKWDLRHFEKKEEEEENGFVVPHPIIPLCVDKKRDSTNVEFLPKVKRPITFNLCIFGSLSVLFYATHFRNVKSFFGGEKARLESPVSAAEERKFRCGKRVVVTSSSLLPRFKAAKWHLFPFLFLFLLLCTHTHTALLLVYMSNRKCRTFPMKNDTRVKMKRSEPKTWSSSFYIFRKKRLFLSMPKQQAAKKNPNVTPLALLSRIPRIVRRVEEKKEPNGIPPAERSKNFVLPQKMDKSTKVISAKK